MSTFFLRTHNARNRMADAWHFACEFLQLGKSVKVTVEECEPTRTLEQNAKLWASLTDIADQVRWMVNGELRWLDKEDWKHILSAGVTKNQRVAAGIEGGFVILGQHTRRMRIGEMANLIEFVLWFGAEHNVVWKNSDEARIEEALTLIAELEEPKRIGHGG